MLGLVGATIERNDFCLVVLFECLLLSVIMWFLCVTWLSNTIQKERKKNEQTDHGRVIALNIIMLSRENRKRSTDLGLGPSQCLVSANCFQSVSERMSFQLLHSHSQTRKHHQLAQCWHARRYTQCHEVINQHTMYRRRVHAPLQHGPVLLTRQTRTDETPNINCCVDDPLHTVTSYLTLP